MDWLNIFGLIFIVLIMIPNIIYALKLFNIPGTWYGWWSDEAFAVYLLTNMALVLAYSTIWIICFRENTVFRALALSILPSVIFLFSGIMSRSVLLVISASIFAPCHILISYKNAK